MGYCVWRLRRHFQRASVLQLLTGRNELGAPGVQRQPFNMRVW